MNGVKELLLKTFQKVEIQDLTGGGDHLEIRVSDKKFQGASKLEQHRMVMSCLAPLLSEQLHAVKIKTQPITGAIND